MNDPNHDSSAFMYLENQVNLNWGPRVVSRFAWTTSDSWILSYAKK